MKDKKAYIEGISYSNQWCTRDIKVSENLFEYFKIARGEGFSCSQNRRQIFEVMTVAVTLI